MVCTGKGEGKDRLVLERGECEMDREVSRRR
jgi:hypothetical protein